MFGWFARVFVYSWGHIKRQIPSLLQRRWLLRIAHTRWYHWRLLQEKQNWPWKLDIATWYIGRNRRSPFSWRTTLWKLDKGIFQLLRWITSSRWQCCSFVIQRHQTLFRGARIVRSHFKWLIDTYRMDQASKIMLGGGSAGAVASYLWGNYLASLLKNPQALYIIPDSGVFVNSITFKTNIPLIQMCIQTLMSIAHAT